MNPSLIAKVTGHSAAKQTADLHYLDEKSSRPHRVHVLKPEAIEAIKHLLLRPRRPRRRIIVVVVRWRR
jgi:hypothetical protein